MELIKKIKETETQALQIKEDAKAEAVRRAEEFQQRKRQSLDNAQQQRNKAIEAAVAEAKSQGLEQVKQLKAQAEKDRQQLHDKTNSRIDTAVASVMSYLKG